MVCCSSIHTTFGMLTTPNCAPIWWVGSSSDGCWGRAASMYGRDASRPLSSTETVTTSRPLGWSSSRSACHPGRSKAQPQYGAQETITTFWPRSDDRRNSWPSTSSRTSSGAAAVVRA